MPSDLRRPLKCFQELPHRSASEFVANMAPKGAPCETQIAREMREILRVSRSCSSTFPIVTCKRLAYGVVHVNNYKRIARLVVSPTLRSKEQVREEQRLARSQEVNPRSISVTRRTGTRVNPAYIFPRVGRMENTRKSLRKRGMSLLGRAFFLR